jgi:hypothetical protein
MFDLRWCVHVAIQCRFRTNSSSIIAMWAAGPPNAIVPSFKKMSASSASDTCSLDVAVWLAREAIIER